MYYYSYGLIFMMAGLLIEFVGGFMLFNELIYLVELKFLLINSVLIELVILIDWMGLIFSGFVILITSLIMFYSKEYVGGSYESRFVYLIFLFLMSMMFLIYIPNLVMVLLGWDGLGLVSYCLVIFYSNQRSYGAGMLTVLMNRVGDLGILMGISLMFSVGSWNYLFNYKFEYSTMVNLGVFLVVLAGMTSSAQMPFSSWLPAAMAAPTPVSALVHSSTLVTAGVYLLVRFNEYLIYYNVTFFFYCLGSLTMIMAGMGALMEYDLKKIVALSTLSQLGLMFMILPFDSGMLCYFHLMSHAFFSALLFMGVGVIIHSFGDNQDIRFLGNLITLLPGVLIFINLSNFALGGFPFLAGFYSKDLIMEFYCFNGGNVVVMFMYYFGALLTVSYSFRMSYYLMVSPFKGFVDYLCADNMYLLVIPMMMLSLLALTGGALLHYLMFNMNFIIYMGVKFKFLSLMSCLLGILIGYLMVSFKSSNFIFLYLKMMCSDMMFLCTLVNELSGLFVVVSSRLSMLDMGWSELLGGSGLKLMLLKGSYFSMMVYSSNLKFYFLLMSIMMLVFMM
uniref:NADH-ubiquinone oxidoreductase chain 5 n=1 Tax=Zorotypus medoensis TaxID=1264643 RepID=A0A0A7C4V5_9NEOP|nr:NADH dehydrogenase subunit 5 [Zorotypus medoensis]AHY35147.1 NADH dehydrogenase subunit 5 [Zorotypus medoensis]